ncbi:hypothetical protein [Candidatus Tisiphia endosymbiont of Dioctria rufipes]|uniref:hypothetical protein n=1 Tax=Candidatus Tisiphia endosymbiont of Dioctria rufipes TaxID=3066255 RepID=UPI00312CAB45
MDIAKKILVLITVVTMGACLGFTIARHFGLSSNDWHILYVAEDELMSLENDRVKNEHLEDRQLFFGQVDKAVNLAVSLPKAYQSSTTKVVYSMSSVKGQNVRSISKEIHSKIIEELEKTDK